MKLNTLLLASAATLIASSAFAADLPSKKAAPAAGSVQVCKVGGMTGFTVPGSDTCLQISGRVGVTVGNGDVDGNDWFGDDNTASAGNDNSGAAHAISGGVDYRINVDARSNSEVGVIRSFISLTGGTDNDHYNESASEDITTGSKTTARKAFIQIGGFTTGLKDSIADIAGADGYFFTSGWSQSGVGMDYQVNVGGMNLGIGLEDSNKFDSYASERPDVVLHLSGASGSVGYALAAVSHDANGENGYALMGSANVTVGSVKLFGYAGMSDKANEYLGGSSDWYLAPTLGLDEATSFGGGLTFTMSPALSLTLQGVHFEDSDEEIDSIGVYASYALAKNLRVNPEVVFTDDGVDDVTSAYVRIQRDF